MDNQNKEQIIAEVYETLLKGEKLLGADSIVLLIRKIKTLRDQFVTKDDFEAFKKDYNDKLNIANTRIETLETAIQNYVTTDDVNTEWLKQVK